MPLSDFQKRVHAWMRSCFGSDIALDTVERNYRVMEEVAELMQAAGLSKERLLEIVDYVYDREPGDVETEIGDTVLCVAAFCDARGISMEAEAFRILGKAWTNIDRIRDKRFTKPAFMRSELPARPERIEDDAAA